MASPAVSEKPLPLSLGEGRGEGLPAPTANAEGEGISFPTADAHSAGLPQSSLLSRDADGKTLEPECHSPADDEAGHSQEDSAAEAMEEPRDEMTQQSENIENVKNEPKFDEDAVIAKTPIIVGVTANSGVKSGLDSFGSFSDFSGQLPLGDAARSRDENRLERGDAATQEDTSESTVSAGSNPEPQISNFKTEQANPEHQTPNLKPQPGRGERHARNSKWEAKQLKQKRALKELKRSFEERIKAGNLLDREMIMDFVRSAGRISEIPLHGLPPPP